MDSQSLLILTVPDDQVKDVSDQTKVTLILFGDRLGMEGSKELRAYKRKDKSCQCPFVERNEPKLGRETGR